MSNEGEENLPGLRYLSLDGGGIRGVAILTTLGEIMMRLKHDLEKSGELPKTDEPPLPCDYFDLIGGTSTGGLIALMLGRLRMSVDEATIAYASLAGKIFSKDNRKKWKNEVFKASTLEEAFKKVVTEAGKKADEKRKRTIIEGQSNPSRANADEVQAMMDPQDNACKTFVCAMRIKNAASPELFRTYTVGGHANYNCFIWEAARATTAALTFFKSISIRGKDGLEEEFCDGGLKWNNPVQVVIKEGEKVFGPKRRVACIVSIGTGHQSAIGLKHANWYQALLPENAINLLKDLATDCEDKAEECQKRYGDVPSLYSRFNVDHGLEEVSWADWDMLGDVKTHTRSYLEKQLVDQKLDQLVDILRTRQGNVTTAELNHIVPGSPARLSSLPAPNPCIGRENDVNAIINSLLEPGSQAVALLGAGGIGKTTVALDVLWDGRVVTSSYKTRYFVECDGATTIQLLLHKLATALGITLDHGSQAGSTFNDQNQLRDRILQVLRSGPAIICLDNFETPWEDPSNRIEVENLLGDIVHIRQLPVLVTMRGTISPTNIDWSLRYTLKALSSKCSTQMFEKISGKADDYAKQLVEVAGGHPLTISILAKLAEGSDETTENLWKRWEHHGTSMASRAYEFKDRLMNLDDCLDLSLASPRMRADPRASEVLALLSVLPDGLSTCNVDRLEELCMIDLRRTLSTLTGTALLYIDKDHHSSRYRILPPTREYAKRKLWPPPKSLLHALVDLCIHIVGEGKDYTTAAAEKIALTEGLNIHAVLKLALGGDRRDDIVIEAAVDYTELMNYYGGGSEELMVMALDSRNTELKPRVAASCTDCLGMVYKMHYRLGEAEKSFIEAFKLHLQAHNVIGQADALNNLGKLQMRQDRLGEAEESYIEAFKLHKQAHSVIGQVNALNDLGALQMRQDRLDEAEKSFIEAYKLYLQVHDVIGQANALNNLGKLRMRQGRLDEAEKSSVEAYKLYLQVHYVIGQADTLNNSGRLQMRRNRLDEAEKSFIKASNLFLQAHNILGQANALNDLGKLQMQQDHLGEAEKSLIEAYKLFLQAHSVIGQATALNSLGQLQMRQDRLSEAEKSFIEAYELYLQVHDVLGQANALNNLGKLQMRQDRLGEAEKSFIEAYKLHLQAHNVFGQANTLNSIGELRMRQLRLDEAEKSFIEAHKFYLQVHDVIGQATTLDNSGRLQMRQDRLDEAEKSFLESSNLYLQAHNVLGQANALNNLGELQLRQDRLDEAKKSFIEAHKLHLQAHNVRSQAKALNNLKTLQMP